eukprot:1197312-Rhodomonas_salina.1
MSPSPSLPQNQPSSAPPPAPAAPPPAPAPSLRGAGYLGIRAGYLEEGAGVLAEEPCVHDSLAVGEAKLFGDRCVEVSAAPEPERDQASR